MSRDIKIKELIEQGKTIKYISEFMGVNHKVVEKVRKQGKYYLNINTKSIIFTSKSISIEEQIFNYIDNYNSDFKYTQSIMSNFLKVNEKQFFRWKSKEDRLIGCDKYGNIDDKIKNECNIFLSEYENIIINKNYKIIPKNYKIIPKIGIYFLYQNNKLMYIGKSKNIDFRLYQHSNNSHINLEGEYDVKIINIGNIKDTELAERVYISMLKPPLNTDFIDNYECGNFFSELINKIPNEYYKKIKIKRGKNNE